MQKANTARTSRLELLILFRMRREFSTNQFNSGAMRSWHTPMISLDGYLVLLSFLVCPILSVSLDLEKISER
jgi:hypothetical protein